MIEIRVDSTLATAPSRQLQDAVLDAIARGELSAGDRLPSVRATAAEALVNPNTVGKAWRALESLGVVCGKNGSGVFVTTEGPEIAERMRREATFAELKRAAEAARLAGHARETLEEILDRTWDGAGERTES